MSGEREKLGNLESVPDAVRRQYIFASAMNVLKEAYNDELAKGTLSREEKELTIYSLLSLADLADSPKSLGITLRNTLKVAPPTGGLTLFRPVVSSILNKGISLGEIDTAIKVLDPVMFNACKEHPLAEDLISKLLEERKDEYAWSLMERVTQYNDPQLQRPTQLLLFAYMQGEAQHKAPPDETFDKLGKEYASWADDPKVQLSSQLDFSLIHSRYGNREATIKSLDEAKKLVHPVAQLNKEKFGGNIDLETIYHLSRIGLAAVRAGEIAYAEDIQRQIASVTKGYESHKYISRIIGEIESYQSGLRYIIDIEGNRKLIPYSGERKNYLSSSPDEYLSNSPLSEDKQKLLEPVSRLIEEKKFEEAFNGLRKFAPASIRSAAHLVGMYLDLEQRFRAAMDESPKN